MPVFICNNCGCLENTALSQYAWQKYHKDLKPVCSECDPDIGKWHGKFEKKKPPKGWLIGKDGFIYHPDDSVKHTKIIGKI